MGVTLRLDGGAVKVGGPRAAREALRPELAAHKPEIIAHLRVAANDATDCAGALRSCDGGLYLPWGPYLSPGDVRDLRAELAELIGSIADAEGWSASCRDEVLVRALRGPLSDLLPNLAHFRERAAQFYAKCQARRLLRSRAWRADDDLTNRGY
ncbi:TubC N-terminal docking domain-containing protein [Paraburkholderia sacchari]